MSYQERDSEVVDYRLHRLDAGGPELRGPAPHELVPGGYIVCVGAAQTFGCFCERPWPALLGERLGLPVLNLGIAGAGPRLFLAEEWLARIAGARLAVVQVMSARSEDCALFESRGTEQLVRRDDGRRLGADEAWHEVLTADLARWRRPLARKVANRLHAAFGRRAVRALVAETRANWVRSYERLLGAIRAPSVLLWFSKRTPRYRPSYRSVWSLFGEFPQLVDAAMVEAVRGHADAYVECISRRGSPQPLVSRFDGRPVALRTGRRDPATGAEIVWTHNDYYPSPQMHEDAAAALEAVCRRLLER